MTYLQVEIVTPNGLTYENHEAELIVVRTVDGELGILANHAPIIVPLTIDKVRIKKERSSQEHDTIAINGGIMEVRDNIVTIIADSAEKATEIDLTRAERAKKRAEETIEEAKKDHDIDELRRAEVALSRALNRINVSGK